MAHDRPRNLALRTHPLVLGVLIFLASELMLFGAMLTTYYNLRSYTPAWPPPDVHLDVAEATIGTVLLALSSGTMLLAQYALARRRWLLARFGLAGSILLGSAFLIQTLHGWSKNTFRIDSHAYGSIYYMMTGVHALHVFIGVLLMLGWFIAVRAPAFTIEDRAGAESIALYWHFVFLVWILIYGSIDVIR